MADFKLYLPKEFKAEGTVFENDPDDTGGATKYGITLDDVHEYGLDANTDGKIDWADVRDMTVDDAAKVLKKLYWDYFKADTINNQSVAEFFVDGGLNMGRILIGKYVQSSLGVTVDGMIGDKTVAAINNHPNIQSTFQQVYDKRKKRYYDIVAAKPSQNKFINGWMNRLNLISFKP